MFCKQSLATVLQCSPVFIPVSCHTYVCVCALFYSRFALLLIIGFKKSFFFFGCIRCFTKCEFCCRFPPAKKCHSHCRSKQWDNNWFQRIGDEISTLSKCSAYAVWLLTKKKKRNKRKCWLALRFKITTNWSVNFAQNPFSSGFLPNSITIGDILILFYFKSFEVRSSRLFCL